MTKIDCEHERCDKGQAHKETTFECNAVAQNGSRLVCECRKVFDSEAALENHVCSNGVCDTNNSVMNDDPNISSLVSLSQTPVKDNECYTQFHKSRMGSSVEQDSQVSESLFDNSATKNGQKSSIEEQLHEYLLSFNWIRVCSETDLKFLFTFNLSFLWSPSNKSLQELTGSKTFQESILGFGVNQEQKVFECKMYTDSEYACI